MRRASKVPSVETVSDFLRRILNECSKYNVTKSSPRFRCTGRLAAILERGISLILPKVSKTLSV